MSVTRTALEIRKFAALAEQFLAPYLDRPARVID